MGLQEDWFAFRPDEDFSPSVIDTGAWLDAPAGRHGFVRPAGERLEFEDGTPVRFWGTNICNRRPACEAATAERWARFLAKYGVNAVRFHKFTWPGDEGLGVPGGDSTVLDPAGLDRMDYFVARLRELGIYTGWSHIYGHRPQEGDRHRLLAYDEVKQAGGAHLKGSTIGLVHFARDLQDLSIELTVNLLQHRNPHTGLRYADDPALAYVELQNEDDIFFPTTMDFVNACPTYKQLFCELFSDWLREKYGSHRGLVEAWGSRAIDAYPRWQSGEDLARRNIYPIAHSWWFSPRGLKSEEETKGTGRRLLDTARFLYETQNDFYGRYIAAIRQTGYRGAIVGSCWQADSGVSHYYNLHSDALAGLVDRHNYFGGSGGHNLHTGKVSTVAMVDAPGSGLLGTGMQMVAGRPFQVSEWLCLIPNEWVSEGPSIVAAYGLGLQGWSGSYAFACDNAGFTPTVESRTIYNICSPTQIGLYPAIARMVYRGDVAAGDVVSVRKVHVPGLAEGELGFQEDVEQDGDVKGFGGDVPREALAVGRVLVEFTDEPEPTERPVLGAHWDREGKALRSTTGQLTWRYARRGYYTVDTPGTQAVVGFAGGLRLELGDVTLEPESCFLNLYVTSLDREAPISEAHSLLITALARARNTDMVYSEDGEELTDLGHAPIVLEPVEARITLKGRPAATVRVLDHVGRRTEATVPVTNEGGDAVFTIGAAYATLYYEVTF